MLPSVSAQLCYAKLTDQPKLTDQLLFGLGQVQKLNIMKLKEQIWVVMTTLTLRFFHGNQDKEYDI